MVAKYYGSVETGLTDPSLGFPFAGYTIGNTQNPFPLSFKVRQFARAVMMCRSDRV
jgi:hypothetical protein